MVIPFLAIKGALSKAASAIGLRGFIAIGAAIALALCWWGWSRAADQRDEARASLKLANAEITLLKTDATLKETAAIERQNDTAAVAAAQEELLHAIAQVPDSTPDAVRVQLGCERLRRTGRIDADLPAACRSDGGSQASPD